MPSESRRGRLEQSHQDSTMQAAPTPWSGFVFGRSRYIRNIQAETAQSRRAHGYKHRLNKSGKRRDGRFFILAEGLRFRRCETGSTSMPILRRARPGTRQSVEPVSTRNRQSQLRLGSEGLRMVTVTCTMPMETFQSNATECGSCTPWPRPRQLTLSDV